MEVKSQDKQVKDTNYAHSGLKNKSTFNPKTYGHKFIDVFKNMVQEDIKKIKSGKKRKVKSVWEAIKRLEMKKEIVIRPADKGLGLVILKESAYKAEMEKVLGDGDTYVKLKSNPTSKVKKKLDEWLRKGSKKGILDKK